MIKLLLFCVSHPLITSLPSLFLLPAFNQTLEPLHQNYAPLMHTNGKSVENAKAFCDQGAL
jgi:hypothetical protein